ncbi:MAG: hypothetical protein SchgKO_10570 [Schleiferiaceae bacterium]
MTLLFVACKKDDDGPLGTPVATEATDVTVDLFIANWQGVTDANAYELHVSTSPDFSTDLIVLDNLGSTSTGVGPTFQNTTHYYKVRANNNGQRTSSFSNVIEVTTLPMAPIALDGTDVNSDSFTANWTSVDGISEYNVYVATGSAPEFGGTILPNYDGVSVDSTSLRIENLQFNTVYYYQVIAVSEDRNSPYSNSQPVLTL